MRVLKWSIGDVPWVLILGFFEITWRPVKGWACYVEASVGQHDMRQERDIACKPVADPISVFWNCQGIGKVGWGELIGARFANNVHGRKMFHRPSYSRCESKRSSLVTVIDRRPD